ncbi:MAG: GNAT family N-acetyltransferase [Christensenellales bacterium]
MDGVRMAAANDLTGIKDLWNVCFHDSKNFTDWFFRYRYAPAYTACIEENGRIISAMQSWPLFLSIRGWIVPAAMVAGVSTHPDYEGRGYMSKMFRFYMQRMREKGILVTPHTPAHLPTFFSKGHYPVSDTAYLVIDQVKTELAPSIPAAPLGGLLDSLYTAYDTFCGYYSGIVMRSLSDFYFKCADYSADGGMAVIVKNANNVEGYTVFYDTDEGIFAEEFVAREKSVQEKLLNELLCRANNRKLRVKLPPDHQLHQFDNVIQIRPQGVMGVADLSALLRTVCGNPRFVASVSDPVIAEHNGMMDFMGAASKQEPHIRLDAGHLTQLLVGYKSLAELEAEGSAEVLNRSMAQEIDRFLPKCSCFIIDEY